MIEAQIRKWDCIVKDWKEAKKKRPHFWEATIKKAKEIFVSGIKDNRAILPGWPEGNILVHPYLYSYKYTVYCIIFKKHYSYLGNTLAVGPARKLVGCAQLWLTIVASWEHQQLL